MFAAVDLGSNSFRFHIGTHNGDSMRIVKSMREPIRLAAGLDAQGNLRQDAMDAALACLARFSAALKKYPLDAVRVVATNTLRVAGNAASFLPAAERAIGYPIEIISGEEEGRLIYMGVACALNFPQEKRVVLDIGGGSTEIILGVGHEISRVESFSIGNVPHSFSFFPNGRITAASFDAAILSARSYFEDAAPAYRSRYWNKAYGSSGTIRALGDALSKNELGDGRISIRNLHALKDSLIAFGRAENIGLAGMKPDRAPVIAGGLAILIGLMLELGIDVLTPVEAGLRMGVLWDLQLRSTEFDRREHSVRELLRRFHIDETRAESAARNAAIIYDMLKPASEKYERQVFWSGLLHEIGTAVSHTGYHKHGAYLIEHADLAGFTTREQRAISSLILGHKGNLRKVSEVMKEPDFAKAILAVRLAVIFMHARLDLAEGAMRLKTKNKIELEVSRKWMDSHPTLSYLIEKEKNNWNEIGIDFIVRVA